MPRVLFGDVRGNTLFGGTLRAVAKPGYSIDGSTANKSKSFEFRCLATGNFSARSEFQRVTCGAESAERADGFDFAMR